jgi:intracellular sulfur oxidation DsrE/DsrF family protein
MRINGALSTFLALAAFATFGVAVKAGAQTQSKATQHKVVFELNSDDHSAQETMLNNVDNLQNALGKENLTIEVVAHAKGLSLLLSKDPVFVDRIQKSSATGVVYAACSNTMRKQKKVKADLHPVAIVVDSGVAEVVRKQEAGFAYIKAGN